MTELPNLRLEKAASRISALTVMPECPNLLNSSHAYHLDVFRDHHPNVFRRS
jgi:hypothetical protein